MAFSCVFSPQISSLFAGTILYIVLYFKCAKFPELNIPWKFSGNSLKHFVEIYQRFVTRLKQLFDH